MHTIREFHVPPLPAQAGYEAAKALEWLNWHEEWDPSTDNLQYMHPEPPPLFVEVGCGVGMHPVLWSKANPNSRLLAFERTHEKYAKAERRFVNNGAPHNVCIVHGDASVMLPHLLGNETAAGFYFLYPNPYPKHRQANLRLAHSPFLHFVRSCLRSGGFLDLATNSQEYAEECEKVLPHLGFSPAQKTIVPCNVQARTHFERKYLDRGEPCYDLVFRKI